MSTVPPRPRIVIVDDHADTTRMLARLLRFHGYDVSEAFGAGKAVALVAAGTVQRAPLYGAARASFGIGPIFQDARSQAGT